jgi:hypothetical protein
MAGADLTSMTSILKEWYVGPLADQLNQDVMVTSLLNVNSQDIEGLKAVVPLHYGRSGGIGSRGEGGTIPSAGKQSYTRAVYNLKYHYARVQVSGPAISNTRSDRGAFLQALKSELDFIRNDLSLDQARQYYGDGTGVIATIASVNSLVATLNSAEAIYKGFLYIGMSCDVGSTTSTISVTAGNVITDVDPSVPSVTFTSSVAGASAGFVIARAGNMTNSTDITTNSEIDAGLLRIVGSNPVGGIDPATTGKGFWKGLSVSKTSSPDINLDDLMVQMNTLNNAGAKSSDITVMTTPGLVRRLFQSEDFKDSVRFVNSTTLAGGFESLSFAAGNGPMTMNSDRLSPWGDVLFIDKAQVQVYSPADWDFLSRDGLTIRWVADVDAFQAILFKYANIGAKRRNTSGLLSGYTDTGF